MPKKCCSNGLRFLWVSVIVLVLDRISKMLAQKYLVFHVPYAVMPFFNFTLSYNRGSAFGFLNTTGNYQAYLFGAIAVIVSTVILVILKRLPPTQRWVGIALALVLGGALGNLWDRFLYGHVVDFIEWYVGQYYWPIFNIADSAVCVGAVMLVLDAFWSKKQKQQKKVSHSS